MNFIKIIKYINMNSKIRRKNMKHLLILALIFVVSACGGGQQSVAVPGGAQQAAASLVNEGDPVELAVIDNDCEDDEGPITIIRREFDDGSVTFSFEGGFDSDDGSYEGRQEDEAVIFEPADGVICKGILSDDGFIGECTTPDEQCSFEYALEEELDPEPELVDELVLVNEGDPVELAVIDNDCEDDEGPITIVKRVSDDGSVTFSFEGGFDSDDGSYEGRQEDEAVIFEPAEGVICKGILSDDQFIGECTTPDEQCSFEYALEEEHGPDCGPDPEADPEPASEPQLIGKSDPMEYAVIDNNCEDDEGPITIIRRDFDDGSVTFSFEGGFDSDDGSYEGRQEDEAVIFKPAEGVICKGFLSDDEFIGECTTPDEQCSFEYAVQA
jgi:hypothetical protein